MKHEDIGGVKVFTNDTHKFGTDAVLLADFAKSGSSKAACDLGCGCGIIPLIWCRDNADLKVTAVDIQTDAIELVNEAINQNSLVDRLTPICADLNQLDKSMSSAFDLVTMNPPYKKLGAGIMSDNEASNIARFELKCTLGDVAKCAARLLMPSGRFCVCHRPERLADIITEMKNYKIEPKRLRLVCKKADSEPYLVLVEGMKGANSGIRIMPNLFIYDDEGNYSDEMKKINKLWLDKTEDISK